MRRNRGVGRGEAFVPFELAGGRGGLESGGKGLKGRAVRVWRECILQRK